MSSYLRITPFPILLCLFLGSVSILSAQQVPTFTLTGRVLDDSTGAPIEKVNVYIANSTLGSPTDEHGVFRIRNVPVGTHELVASIVGYVLNMSFISLTDSSQRVIEIRLKPRVLELGPVEVVGADPAVWRKDLARFTESFFGKGPNADQCRFVNPEILSFTTDWSGTFEAQATEPLRIENMGLGYEVELQLITFVVGPRWLTYGWRAFFREIPSLDDDQRAEWQKSRMKAYKGSLRHFFASLVNGCSEKEGFSTYAVTNPRLSNSRMRMPVSEDEILSSGSVPNEKLLRFLDYLEVEFDSGPSIVWRSPRGITAGSNSQSSWLQLARDYVTINSMGEYVEPYSLNVSGEWALQRVADALPFNYSPAKNK
ncbi:MAG: carboxypeptidase-like regulatory domain-containing protein [Ignavibacteriales bacterium]|nr:carboxypeptidase-like regulatory domain-containing protein [Ignavibacteriales bacterium]